MYFFLKRFPNLKKSREKNLKNFKSSATTTIPSSSSSSLCSIAACHFLNKCYNYAYHCHTVPVDYCHHIEIDITYLLWCLLPPPSASTCSFPWLIALSLNIFSSRLSITLVWRQLVVICSCTASPVFTLPHKFDNSGRSVDDLHVCSLAVNGRNIFKNRSSVNT
jgi:hypothetical protein